MNKNICPKCGGKIVAEAIGDYGIVFYLRKDGTIGRKLREVKYGHAGVWMYYCTDCGENYEEKNITGREY